jgi:hypothetical protein
LEENGLNWNLSKSQIKNSKFYGLAYVVTHFWVPTNIKKNIYIYKKKKKEFEQCRFDTVPLPAARPAKIKGAEPRQ